MPAPIDACGRDRDDVDSGRARDAGLRSDRDTQPLRREVIPPRRLGMSAVTVTPAAEIVSEEPIVAVLVTLATLSETAAPIEVWFVVARPSARARALRLVGGPDRQCAAGRHGEAVVDLGDRAGREVVDGDGRRDAQLWSRRCCRPICWWPSSKARSSRCWRSGCATLGESEPPSLWANAGLVLRLLSAVPPLPLSLCRSWGKRRCSLAMAVAWLDAVAGAGDADSAAGSDVAVQVGQERVCRHVDDHRGPEPDGSRSDWSRRQPPSSPRTTRSLRS